MPWIEVSEEEMEREERMRIRTLIADADERGDKEEASRLRRQFAPQAEVLMSMKEIAGADCVRRIGWDTRHADKEFGPGWLDR